MFHTITLLHVRRFTCKSHAVFVYPVSPTNDESLHDETDLESFNYKRLIKNDESV